MTPSGRREGITRSGRTSGMTPGGPGFRPRFCPTPAYRRGRCHRPRHRKRAWRWCASCRSRTGGPARVGGPGPRGGCSAGTDGPTPRWRTPACAGAGTSASWSHAPPGDGTWICVDDRGSRQSPFPVQRLGDLFGQPGGVGHPYPASAKNRSISARAQARPGTYGHLCS